MSAGILKMPVIVRVSVGSKYGAQHSQDWTALCAHIPGLKVCFPATPYEARGLMTAALNGTDPVIFFESQRIYDMPEQFHEGGVPAEPYEIKIGDTNLIRKGDDVTIITLGAVLYRATKAADELKEKYGVNAEIINIHSLVPLDYAKIVESVKKTGKVVLVSDACARGSFLNDIAQNINTLCFDYLDAPVAIVGAKNWITPPFEFDEFFFPQDKCHPAQTGVMISESGVQSYYCHRRLSENCHGTGDVYASAFVGALMKGLDAYTAAKIAADYTLLCMENTRGDLDHTYGVKFEPMLGTLMDMIRIARKMAVRD